MATRTDRFMDAARSAARLAKEWATMAARETELMLKEARKEADSRDRRERLRRTLHRAAKVLKVVGKAAAVAGMAAAIAAARAEQNKRKLTKGS